MFNCNQSPSPMQYLIPSDFEKNKEINCGKSFGIDRKYYENIYIPNTNIVCRKNSEKIPGPGTYQHENIDRLGKNALKISLKSRIPIYESKMEKVPPPNYYYPLFRLVEDAKYSRTSFGIGNRGKYNGNFGNFMKDHQLLTGPDIIKIIPNLMILHEY